MAVAVVLVLLVGSIQPAPAVPAAAWDGFWVVAHRGSMEGVPENTLPALRVAAARGADAAEVDVALTADGVAVLMHDLWLERTTDGSGALHETDWDDVARLRAASVPVPRLADALREAGVLGLPLWIDPKGLPEDRDALVDAVAAEVGAAGARDRVWLLSASCPEGLRCLALGVDGVGPGVDGVLLRADAVDDGVVAALDAADLRLAVWGVESGPLPWPVDAVVVDRPQDWRQDFVVPREPS